jgi:hypothetical protein
MNSTSNFSLPTDIYRVSKAHLQNILTKFNIKYREDDIVADLRPIVADLKAFLKSNLTEEKKFILSKLLNRRENLTEGELEKYPGLIRIEQFIRERDNLYDTPETQEQPDHAYEDIDFSDASSTDSLPETQHNRHLNDNSVERVSSNTNMSKENIPLISAGTYHGLESENCQDFVDKYELAAKSNNWSLDTKLNLFPAHLANTALAWYKYYSTNKNVNNWDDLKKAFISAFTPAAQAQTLQSLLERKVQGRDQPVLAYYLEILTLCKRHDPDTTDKQIIHYIIQGLRPEYCDKILNETCDTLDQLEKNLKKIEIQMEIRALNREKYSRAESTGTNDKLLDKYRQEIDSLQSDVRNLTQAISNMNVRQNTPPNTGLYNSFGNPQRSYKQYTPRANQYSNRNTYTHAYQPQPDARQKHQPYSPRTTNPPYVGTTRDQAHTPRAPASKQTTYYKYCHICKRNNHNTQQCRFNTQAKYCSFCKMTNHDEINCFKKPKSDPNQKN